MTIRPATREQVNNEDREHDDPIAVPLSFLLWGLVTVALFYGVFSTLSKVLELFS